MKNQNNLKTQNSKSPRFRRFAVNLIGVWMILFVVLGCKISEFKFGETTKTGNNSNSTKRDGDKSSDENLPLKEKVIGKWEGTRGSEKMTMEFTSDKITMSQGGKSKPARYKVVDEETIAVADGGDENYNEKLKVKFSGGKMTVSDASGKNPMEFTRTGGNDSSKVSSNEDSSSSESSSSTDSTESREDSRLAKDLGIISAQFIRADRTADVAELERILADDYVITMNGKQYTKREFINDLQRDKNWVSSQSKDTRLITKESNRAVIGYKLIIKYTDTIDELDCRSEFVKSDRWRIRRHCY